MSKPENEPAVSDHDRKLIEEYLVDRYQLYNELPISHPYLKKATGKRPRLAAPIPGLLSHFRADRGVVTDRAGNVIVWIDWAQPWYRRWVRFAYWKARALFARKEPPR